MWVSETEREKERDRKRGKDRKQAIHKIITLSMQRNFGIYTIVTIDRF